VQWFRPLLAALSPRRLGFNLRPVHIIFIVDWDRFFPVFIIPPMLRSHLHLHVAVTRNQMAEAWRPSKKQHRSFGNRGALDRKVLPLYSVLYARCTPRHFMLNCTYLALCCRVIDLLYLSLYFDVTLSYAYFAR
jgi:hypothetical protein